MVFIFGSTFHLVFCSSYRVSPFRKITSTSSLNCSYGGFYIWFYSVFFRWQIHFCDRTAFNTKKVASACYSFIFSAVSFGFQNGRLEFCSASHDTDKYHQDPHLCFSIEKHTFSTARQRHVAPQLTGTSTVRHLDLDNVPDNNRKSPPSSNHGEMFGCDKKFGALAVAV